MLLNVETKLLRKEAQTMKKMAMNMAKYFRATDRYFAGYFCYAYYYLYRRTTIVLPMAV